MDHEYPTDPLTAKDVKRILKKIGREISWHKSDQLLTALNNVKLDLEKFSSPHQELKKFKKLKIALEHALEVDPASNPSLVRAGEEFAERYGHSFERELMVFDRDTLEEVDQKVFTHGSYERLNDLWKLIVEVLDWISLAVEGVPTVVRQNSFRVRVIGEVLPRIYEKIFDAKFTASVGGPGTRFIKAARATMPEFLPNYKSETIVKYCQRMKNEAKKAAFAVKAKEDKAKKKRAEKKLN